MLELIISRLAQHYLGWQVVIKTDDDLRHIATINGNDPEFFGPIILLSLDQHIIYGLSHPEVVSKILQRGPQCLLATKEMGHNLFEHGMKASLGKIKLNMNHFSTSVETFYSITTKASNLTLITGVDNQIGCLIQPRSDVKPILVSSYVFVPKESDKELLTGVRSIAIEDIRTHVIADFKIDGFSTPK